MWKDISTCCERQFTTQVAMPHKICMIYNDIQARFNIKTMHGGGSRKILLCKNHLWLSIVYKTTDHFLQKCTDMSIPMCPSLLCHQLLPVITSYYQFATVLHSCGALSDLILCVKTCRYLRVADQFVSPLASRPSQDLPQFPLAPNRHPDPLTSGALSPLPSRSYRSLLVSWSMSSCSGASSRLSTSANSRTKKTKCLNEVLRCASSSSCITCSKCSW